MEKLSIGELAKKANVNIETIRYYERRGLLPEPPIRDALGRLVKKCTGKGPIGSCPILEELYQ